MNQISFPGHTEINSLDIISSDGRKLDVRALVYEIVLYEDMFSNTLSGYLILNDAMDLINTVPLVGEELLVLSFITPTLKTGISNTFYIYKRQSISTAGKSDKYILNFCSTELINSENSKISKSYSGKISESVKNIFTDSRFFASNTKLYVESTKNSLNFIPAYWTPIETFNWLADRAISEKDQPNYMFFQTNQSYEFVPISTLISTSPEREYVLSDVDSVTSNGVNGDLDNKYRSVELCEMPVTYDYLKSLNSGQFASTLYTLDMTSKSIKKHEFDQLKDFAKTEHLNPNPRNTSNLMRRKFASLYFIEKNNYLFGKNIQNNYNQFLQRNSSLASLENFKISIKVPGRTDIKVGNTVKFIVPELRQILKEDIISGDITSEYYSGKYLVTAIRHQINDGNKHTTYMELISDSFVKKLK